jgi:NAD(P)-dependent dehydrogenase (short-subunit alcohol dehydrogenase family)
VNPVRDGRKRILITGANSGLGFQAARSLAGDGHEVILAVRSFERGAIARRRILDEFPDATVHVSGLDLASLTSVREFAASTAETFGTWDVLVNNAAVKVEPGRTLTPDGFERYFGVNHLGHFALTGLLVPFAAPAARVITVTSLAYRLGSIRFHDLRWDHGHTPTRAYAASKLANLLFARELQRKAVREGRNLLSVAVHPGLSTSETNAGYLRRVEWIFASPAEEGAAALVYAATSPAVHGGEFIGPAGPFQIAGEPMVLRGPKIRHEEAVAHRLWRISGQLTRVSW